MIDIVRWEESTERFIANLLAPLRLTEASFDEASREAKVRVVRRTESHSPDIALRSKLLMYLTGWKLASSFPSFASGTQCEAIRVSPRQRNPVAFGAERKLDLTRHWPNPSPS
jgi:hypothetical protein